MLRELELQLLHDGGGDGAVRARPLRIRLRTPWRRWRRAPVPPGTAAPIEAIREATSSTTMQARGGSRQRQKVYSRESQRRSASVRARTTPAAGSGRPARPSRMMVGGSLRLDLLDVGDAGLQPRARAPPSERHPAESNDTRHHRPGWPPVSVVLTCSRTRLHRWVRRPSRPCRISVSRVASAQSVSPERLDSTEQESC